MKTRIITLLAVVIFAGLAGRMEARDYCGGHHHHHGSHSSFGFSFGVPLFYSRPVYSYHPYPAHSWYGSRYYGYSPAVRTSSMSADVQIALARRGYYHGAIDGIIGPMSRSAIRRYQISRGLPVSGVIDYPLLRTLGIR